MNKPKAETKIAVKFLEAYYNAIYNNDESVCQFYNETAQVCRVKNQTPKYYLGPAGVKEAQATHLGSGNHRVDVKSVAVVPAPGSSILLTTSGKFLTNTTATPFVQTFILSPVTVDGVASSYVIVSESLTFLDVTEVEAVAPVAKAPIAIDDSATKEAARKAAAAAEEAARIEAEAAEAAAAAEAIRASREAEARKADEAEAARRAEIAAEAALKAAAAAAEEAARQAAAAAAAEEERQRIAAEEAAAAAAAEEAAREAARARAQAEAEAAEAARKAAEPRPLTDEEIRLMSADRPPAHLIYESNSWAGKVATDLNNTNVIIENKTPVPSAKKGAFISTSSTPATSAPKKEVKEPHPSSTFLFVSKPPATDAELTKVINDALILQSGQVVKVTRQEGKPFCFVQLNSAVAARELFNFGSLPYKTGSMRFEGTDFKGTVPSAAGKSGEEKRQAAPASASAVGSKTTGTGFPAPNKSSNKPAEVDGFLPVNKKAGAARK